MYTAYDGQHVQYGPCSPACRYVPLPGATDAHFRCPAHGRVHVCDGTACSEIGDPEHPMRQPVCAWTGRLRAFGLAFDWASIDQYIGGLGNVHHLPHRFAPVARGELVIHLFKMFLSDSWRDAAARHFSGEIQRDRRVRFGVPYFLRRLRVPHAELGAFADIVTACPCVAGMTKDAIEERIVLILRNVCRGTRDYNVSFLPYWAFYLVPYGAENVK